MQQLINTLNTLTMSLVIKETEFANTKDHDILNDLSEFMYENEKNNDILYYFNLMELYTFFNSHIDVEKSIHITEYSDDEYDDDDDY